MGIQYWMQMDFHYKISISLWNWMYVNLLLHLNEEFGFRSQIGAIQRNFFATCDFMLRATLWNKIIKQSYKFQQGKMGAKPGDGAAHHMEGDCVTPVEDRGGVCTGGWEWYWRGRLASLDPPHSAPEMEQLAIRNFSIPAVIFYEAQQF